MSTGRQLMNRLYYFTIEDESILAEAFAKFERDFLAIAYKVNGTEDVFVTTQTTKEAMDRHDVPYTLLAEEESSRIGVLHTPQSREELLAAMPGETGDPHAAEVAVARLREVVGRDVIRTVVKRGYALAVAPS